jgi:DivIVA domain-containing protein
VALDRQSIVGHDFPAARRGYDPRAVDAHLAAIADEVDELRRRADAGPAAADLRARIEALEADVGAMVEALREGAQRLRAGLDELTTGAGRLGAGAAGAPGASVSEGVAPTAVGSTLGSVPGGIEADEEVGEEPALAAVDEAPAAPMGRSRDVAGARIVALERALRKVPREETDRFLAEHFDLPDRAAVVEEAYQVASQR